MLNHPHRGAATMHHSKQNRRRIAVQLGADWTPYTDAIPQDCIALGTATQGSDTGALVFNEAKQEYWIITQQIMRIVNENKVQAAIHQAQTTPAELES